MRVRMRSLRAHARDTFWNLPFVLRMFSSWALVEIFRPILCRRLSQPNHHLDVTILLSIKVTFSLSDTPVATFILDVFTSIISENIFYSKTPPFFTSINPYIYEGCFPSLRVLSTNLGKKKQQCDTKWEEKLRVSSFHRKNTSTSRFFRVFLSSELIRFSQIGNIRSRLKHERFLQNDGALRCTL